MLSLTLILDSETSGLPKPGSSVVPDLVELSAKLVDDDGRVGDEFTRIIKPDGWSIEPEAFQHHRISEQWAHQVGVPLALALADLKAMAENASAIVAHHLEFDSAVIIGAIKRAKADHLWWLAKRRLFFCTMERSAGIVNMPGKFDEPKFPTLEEAHNFFYPASPYRSPHRAAEDREACARIYSALRERSA